MGLISCLSYFLQDSLGSTEKYISTLGDERIVWESWLRPDSVHGAWYISFSEYSEIH